MVLIYDTMIFDNNNGHRTSAKQQETLRRPQRLRNPHRVGTGHRQRKIGSTLMESFTHIVSDGFVTINVI